MEVERPIPLWAEIPLGGEAIINGDRETISSEGQISSTDKEDSSKFRGSGTPAFQGLPIYSPFNLQESILA